MTTTKSPVLITGAGIGIGSATGKAFGKAGYHVFVDRRARGGGRGGRRRDRRARAASAEFHHLDVRSTAAPTLSLRPPRSASAARLIVANAGIAHRVPLANLDDAKWDHTFDVDLKGIFRVVRPAVAGMRARKKGAIVCLSSIMGVAYGWDEHVHYSSAKAGVVGLSAASRSNWRRMACA